MSKMPTPTVVQQKVLKSVGLIAMIMVFNMTAPLSTDMYLPAFPTLLSEFSTTSAMLNFTLVGFFVCFALGMLVFGAVSDKLGRKPLLLFGVGLYGLASWGCAGVQTVDMLIVYRLLQAIGAGCMVSVTTAIIKDSFDDIARPRVIAVLQMLGVLAPTIAPGIGAFLMDYFSWRATFYVLALFSIVMFLLTLLYTETLTKEKRFQGNVLMSLTGLWKVYKDKKFSLFLACTSLTSLIYMAFIAISSYIYISHFGLSKGAYGLYFALNSLVLVVGPIVYLRFAQTARHSRLLLYIFGGIFLAGIAMIAIGWWHPVVFYFCFLPVTFFGSFLRAFSTNILLSQHDQAAGATASVINFTNTAVGSLGMVIGALSWSSYILGLGVIMMGASALSLLLWYAFRKAGYTLRGLRL